MPANKRGGSRKGSGRKLKGERHERTNVSLAASVKVKAKRIGRGNLSKGIDITVREYEEGDKK